MKFFKIESCGNDYIYIYSNERLRYKRLAKKLSNRHFGIGSDGVIFLSDDDKCDIKMAMYNADGSRGKICGNALRGATLYLKKVLNYKVDSFFIKTDVGIKNVKAKSYKDNQGEFIVPFDNIKYTLKNQVESEIINKKIIKNFNKFYITFVCVGNNHIVVFNGKNKDKIVEIINKMGIIKGGVNIDFVSGKDNHLFVETFERGSGWTLSCGSGVVASCLAYNKFYKQEYKEFFVETLGGKLKVYIKDKCYLQGKSKIVFKGEVF